MGMEKIFRALLVVKPVVERLRSSAGEAAVRRLRCVGQGLVLFFLGEGEMKMHDCGLLVSLCCPPAPRQIASSGILRPPACLRRE